jgi:hypothetical protein
MDVQRSLWWNCFNYLFFREGLVAKACDYWLVWSLTDLLNKYWLRKIIIVYVKDERSNLNAMTSALKSITSCEYLCLKESFHELVLGTPFQRHVTMAQ